MSVVDRERFLQCVSNSGILDQEKFESWRAEVESVEDSKDLARDLIRKKLATSWQAKMLLKGANRLTLGNFLLTDRIEKSAFGDLFAGVHRQLSRDVAIQYMTAEKCSSKEVKKRVFEFGSKLAELDHPNLVHVYDIDEERGRVYLVSERGKGKLLNEFLKEDSRLENRTIAKILTGCLKGVIYAHSKGVILSGISESSIRVNRSGAPQIDGLTQNAVQNALSDSPAGVDDDFEAVSEVAERLLGALESSPTSSAELTDAIRLIKSDPSSALASLKVIHNSRPDGEIKLAPESPRAPATSEAMFGKPGKASSSDALGTKEESSAVSSTAQRNEGLLTALARKNPVALIAASAIVALMLIGGTVFAASRLVAKNETLSIADASQANAISKKEVPTSVSDSESPGKKSHKKKSPPPKVERPNFNNSGGALSSRTASDLPSSSVTDPEANKARIDAIFNKPEDEDVASEDRPATGEAEVASVIAAKKGDDQPVEDNEQSAEDRAVAKAEPKEMPATSPSASKKQENAPKAGDDPFAKFAKTVDLPDVSGSEQVSLGKLVLDKRHLMGAEILSTPAAHRTKPIFVLERSSEDRQTWDIKHKKKKKSDPVTIAKLQKTPDELKFNWMPEAKDISAANYLRNCRVKLSTPKHSHWLTLRKPLKIDGFQLGKNKGSVKVDFEIPWMPNPASLNAMANGISFERLNKEDWKEKSTMEPPEVFPNVPARMYFHKDADRFLSLDILADVRKKLILQAALVIQPSPDQPGTVLENPSSMPQVAAQIRQMAQQAQRESNAAEKSKLKSDEKKHYRDIAKKAMDQAELTAYYEHLVPQLVEKDIPVTISYSLNDQHRIILAYTADSSETKD